MNTEDKSGIFQFEKANVGLVSQMFLEVYQDDPLMIHFFPQESTRAAKIKALFEFQLKSRLFSVVRAEQVEFGVCVFEQPDQPNSFITLRDIIYGIKLVSKIGLSSLFRILKFQSFSHSIRHEAAGTKHWYLDLFLVSNSYQNKGYGQRMLIQLLEQAKNSGSPVYLEAMTEKNVSLYKKYGFHVVSESQIPGTNISYYSMCKEFDRMPENEK